MYNGGSLSQMVVTTVTTEGEESTTTTETLYFAYDASGNPQTVTYNGTLYYYSVNLQGDVVAILDSNGTAVVSYAYDAWGNLLSTTGTLSSTLGTANPLTYRGYVYDSETALYYLQSRYYNPEMGRFINSDILMSTGQGFLGNNMFCYCLNSPINMTDKQGQDAIYVVNKTWGPGLPIVGHAIVYLQNKAGQWYKTEFTGEVPDKSTATVICYPVDTSVINDLLNGNEEQNISYKYFVGDFSESLLAAEIYAGTDFGGYHFVSNNCKHYAKTILLEGNLDNFFMDSLLTLDISPIPTNVWFHLTNAQTPYIIWEGGSSYANKGQGFLEKAFSQ